jgi:nucleoside-diphosphate-sugar epimerase
MPDGDIVLVTGATGFVGSALLAALDMHGKTVRLVSRRAVGARDASFVSVIDASTNWSKVLESCDAVVHLAARTPGMQGTVENPIHAFREVNVEGTLNLARQAATAGVKRFVFMSSIKVNGEQTQIGHPFTPGDTPDPSDPYGISKCEGEEGLRQIADQTGMEVVIIRPVLVYGPGVKGNFLSMMRWLLKGVPLPLGAIHNARSLVALENLVDLIVTCIDHPAAANQTFLVSDGEDLSTPELLKRTAAAMGIRPRLIPVPESIIQTGAALLGKRDVSRRLCGSLQVDISKTRDLLGWNPPVTVDWALRKTADDFLRKQHG